MKKRGRKNKMKDNNKDTINVDVSTKNQETEIFEPLMSEVEVRQIVKEFVIAWIDKEITIIFPSIKEVRENFKAIGENNSECEALTQIVKMQTEITNLVSICAGRIKATPDEQRKAMYELFYKILFYRTNDRIQGQFMHNTVKEQINEIKEDVKELTKRFEDLYFYVKSKIPDDSSLKCR